MFSLDVIMTSDLITAEPNDSLADARTLMQAHRIRHLPVLNEQGTLVGLLTQSDVLAATDSILRSAENRIRASEVRVSDVMITQIATVAHDASLRQAALFLESRKIGCLPVLCRHRNITMKKPYFNL